MQRQWSMLHAAAWLVLSACTAREGAGDARETARKERAAGAQEGAAPREAAASEAAQEGHVQERGHDQHHGRPPLPTAEELAALPPDGGPRWNRLVFEQSPYLQQHAANPVDWYPWGDEAFAKARAEDKPIFLSIGYSTCHWCHVMERESFEDEQVAELLNRWFVPVKVDREERPDLDKVHMDVTQALTGSGGWPMTVVLAPDGRPFFAGTYFPKASRLGRIGMLELLPKLHGLWSGQREAAVANADRIVEHLRSLQGGAPGALPGRELLEAGFRQLAGRHDLQHGGFGGAPKFPVPHDLLFLLAHAERSGDPTAREMALHTLRAMQRGGIHDHVGGGFHRYSTDREWLLPHFEKMLYDQALLALAYVAAWQVSGEALFRETAEDVLGYVLRDMTSPEGGFFSAEDADSEGEEGRFYVWTPAQLEQVLGAEDAALVAGVYGVEPGGNFRDQATGERTGASILHLDRPLEELAEERELDVAALRDRLAAARAKLFAAREERVHPLKDDKVLADWNGLMIAAMARAGRAFDDERYARAADRAADFVLANLRGEDGRLLKRWRNGQAGMPATLEDHAFLAWGLAELYQTTFDPRRLQQALELVETMDARFVDPERGGYYMSADDGAKLLVRPREVYDGALPSGNSAAALAQLQLARLTGRTELEQAAEGVLKAFADQVARAPSGHTLYLLALDFAVGPAFEVVVAGARDEPGTRAMLAALGARHLPGVVVLQRPPGEDPAVARVAPFTRETRPIGGRATAYVCRDFACQAPVHEVEALLAALDLTRPD